MQYDTFISELKTLPEYTQRIDFMIANIDRLAVTDQQAIVNSFEKAFTDKYKGMPHKLLGFCDEIVPGFSATFHAETNETNAAANFAQLLDEMERHGGIPDDFYTKGIDYFGNAYRFFPTVFKVKGKGASEFVKAFDKYVDTKKVGKYGVAAYLGAAYFATRDVTPKLTSQYSFKKPGRGRKLF